MINMNKLPTWIEFPLPILIVIHLYYLEQVLMCLTAMPSLSSEKLERKTKLTKIMGTK